jgi:hypothetical protein
MRQCPRERHDTGRHPCRLAYDGLFERRAAGASRFPKTPLSSIDAIVRNTLAGFHEDPKDKVGALFWRSHRCARIIFSLKYEMGEMTAAVRWLATVALIDPSTLTLWTSEC